MKKILFAAAFIIAGFLAQPAHAQVSISLGVNIGSQPDWGPVGYDRVNYYYMPDIDAYYDVPARQYVYYENNVWVHRTYLPARYRSYNMYNGYKVVINRPNPWLKNTYYRTHYASYRGRPAQPVLRDHRGPGPGGPGHDNGRHNGWDKGRGHGNGHGGDHGHGRGHGHH